jgi:hypothetical protein
LPSALRIPFETSLGQSLADVRLHHGSAASRVARALGAEAFTVGNDIVVRSELYRPESSYARELLAHEAVHRTAASGRSARAAEVSARGARAPRAR